MNIIKRKNAKINYFRRRYMHQIINMNNYIILCITTTRGAKVGGGWGVATPPPPPWILEGGVEPPWFLEKFA